MDSIEEVLKKNRPNLSNNSLKTYISLLKNLHKKIFGEKIDLKNFKEYNKILDFLKSIDGNKRKSTLSALVVFCNNDCEQYRDLMISDAIKYNEEQKENKKNDKEKQNWINQDAIKTIFNKYEKQAKLILKQKEFSNNDLQKIQNYIIICLMSGIFIPPRRSLDWTEFKIKNIDKNKDNFIDKNNLIFNTYKTSKFYKQASIPLPPKLKSILKKWISINNISDYLLFDKNGNKLTPVKLTQRNNKIYDGKISTNMLRHSFITEKYNNLLPKLKEIDDLADSMGHSLEQHLEYIKN